VRFCDVCVFVCVFFFWGGGGAGRIGEMGTLLRAYVRLHRSGATLSSESQWCMVRRKTNERTPFFGARLTYR
jgi:hypothetical protein